MHQNLDLKKEEIIDFIQKTFTCFTLIVSLNTYEELTDRMSKQKLPQECNKSANIFHTCFANKMA